MQFEGNLGNCNGITRDENCSTSASPFISGTIGNCNVCVCVCVCEIRYIFVFILGTSWTLVFFFCACVCGDGMQEAREVLHREEKRCDEEERGKRDLLCDC